MAQGRACLFQRRDLGVERGEALRGEHAHPCAILPGIEPQQLADLLEREAPPCAARMKRSRRTSSPS
jgi:hypothetical protein